MSVFSFVAKVTNEVVEGLISECKLFWWEIGQKPWYLKPLMALLCVFSFFILLFINIGSIQINIFPRKFKTWELFEKHLDNIMGSLKQNDELNWVNRLYQAKYVSQSSWEVIYELIDELQWLKNDSISKKLNLRRDIKIALVYLQSFK